jgi:hypothetical protein
MPEWLILSIGFGAVASVIGVVVVWILGTICVLKDSEHAAIRRTLKKINR